MPLQEHPDHTISRAEPGNDVAWMDEVLSPCAADAALRPALPVSLDDTLALTIDPDLPPSSLRLQFLRAWIAARESHPSKALDHA